MNFSDNFINTCYTILSRKLHFPDVADTYKEILEGMHYRDSFPNTHDEYEQKKNEIISYIIRVRTGNVIDSFNDTHNPFKLFPVYGDVSLYDGTQEMVYNNLCNEIQRLILKGIHQTIKHYYRIEIDEALAAELVKQDSAVLRKYHLIETEGKKNG